MELPDYVHDAVHRDHERNGALPRSTSCTLGSLCPDTSVQPCTYGVQTQPRSVCAWGLTNMSVVLTWYQRVTNPSARLA